VTHGAPSQKGPIAVIVGTIFRTKTFKVTGVLEQPVAVLVAVTVTAFVIEHKL